MKISPHPIRVLLIEDDEFARLGLRTQIEKERDLQVVAEASGRRDALAAAASHRPDIILLDLNLGEDSGIDLITELRAASPEVRVLIVTGMRDLEAHQQAISRGAMGLLLKQDAVEHINKAIKEIYRGDVWFNRQMMMKVIEGMYRGAAAKQEDPESAKIAALTEREREVISLIGEGLRNKQVAARLRPIVSETTVRHHLSSIYDKLDVADRLELVIYAYIHGLATIPKTLPYANNGDK